MSEALVKSRRHNVVLRVAFVAYDRLHRGADRFQLKAFDETAKAFHRTAEGSQESRLAKAAFSPSSWAAAGALMGVISGAPALAALGLSVATGMAFKVSGFLGYIAGTVGGLAWHAPRYKKAVSFFRDYEQMRDYRLSIRQKQLLLDDFQRIGQKTAKAANVTSRFCAAAAAIGVVVVFAPSLQTAEKPQTVVPAQKPHVSVMAPTLQPRLLKPVA